MDLSCFRSKRGLEIAGPSRIFETGQEFPVYQVIESLDDFSFPRPAAWGGRELDGGQGFRFRPGKSVRKQYIGDATQMREIRSNEYDFVIASHVFEHIANPLKAAREWLRILKPRGLLLLVIPHRDATFDRRRPITRLAHLKRDLNRDVDEADRTHFDEVRRLSTKRFTKKWFDSVHIHRGLHHHVFSTASVVSIYDELRIKIMAVEPLLPYHIAVLGTKTSRWRPEMNDAFTSRSAAYRQLSPFPTDRGGARRRSSESRVTGLAAGPAGK